MSHSARNESSTEDVLAAAIVDINFKIDADVDWRIGVDHNRALHTAEQLTNAPCCAGDMAEDAGASPDMESFPLLRPDAIERLDDYWLRRSQMQLLPLIDTLSGVRME
jgi:hypothetical protein